MNGATYLNPFNNSLYLFFLNDQPIITWSGVNYYSSLKHKGMKRFENQVAVVSGGADGLGKGIAARIASEGCSVVLFDINEKVLKQAVSDFKKMGYAAEGIVVNVAEEGSVRDGIDQVENSAWQN